MKPLRRMNFATLTYSFAVALAAGWRTVRGVPG
jgi:hypothetical protein